MNDIINDSIDELIKAVETDLTHHPIQETKKWSIQQESPHIVEDALDQLESL